MGGMSDYAFSLRMRDTIARMAEEVVNRLRPPERYGVVSSIDTASRRCSVVLNGDTDPVTVSMGSMIPLAAGQVVRVGGTNGDKYISDIIGGVRLDRLRILALNDLSPTSTLHGLQIGLDNDENVAIDNNEMMARNNGVAVNYLIQGEGGGVQIGGNIPGTDNATDELKVGRASGLRTILNYNQLRALVNGAATTLYLNYGGGNVSICENDLTKGILSPGTMRAKSVLESTNQATYTSQTASLGSPVCGFAFIAPPSGQILLEVASFTDVTTTNGIGRVWGSVYTGGTVGSGSVVYTGDGDAGPLIIFEAHNGTGNLMCGSGFSLVTGLTPGTTYNCAVNYRCGNGVAGESMGVNSRRITMIPVM